MTIEGPRLISCHVYVDTHPGITGEYTRWRTAMRFNRRVPFSVGEYAKLVVTTMDYGKDDFESHVAGYNLTTPFPDLPNVICWTCRVPRDPHTHVPLPTTMRLSHLFHVKILLELMQTNHTLPYEL